MTIRLARYVVFASGVALVVAACGGDDDDSSSTTTAASDFTSCMVTDLGGVDDKSFNETSWNGLVQAHDDGLSAEPELRESESADDYGKNLEDLIQMDCGLIVTVGFLLGDATEKAAKDFPDKRFAMVDNQHTKDDGTVDEIDNVKPMVFNTHEAAFLAGYLAAAQSETDVVGTWGGQQLPTVTIFMDGFVDGVGHFNDVHDESVDVLGWDKEDEEGEFVGNFDDAKAARALSDEMIDDGADILLPVAGPLGVEAAKAAQEEEDVSIIWVDSDGVESVPDYADVILTSVTKGMDVAVAETVEETVDANYTNVPYIGTLANGGVGLAPFHEFADDVPDEIKKELADLQRQIIIGELTVTSESGH